MISLNGDKKENTIKQFLIQSTIMSSFCVILLSKLSGKFLTSVGNLLIDTIFSKDLDENGIPDLKEINNYNITIGTIKLPMGRIIIEFLKLLFMMGCLWLIMYFVIHHTELIQIGK
jgi:hypothetical protein